MTKLKYLFPLLLTSALFAQTPTPKPHVPNLSTSDKIAIQTIEQKKQDAQKQFSDAMQAETAIFEEFKTGHPGFHVNPQTFVVEPDATIAKPSEKK